jgi:hypothetical protein
MFRRMKPGGVGYPVGSVIQKPHQKKDENGNPTGPFMLVRIKLDNRMYCAHHLAVLWMTGKWPNGAVKHLDGNHENLAWSNLYYHT